MFCCRFKIELPSWLRNGAKSSKISKMSYRTSLKSTRLWSSAVSSSPTYPSSRVPKARSQIAEAMNTPLSHSHPVSLRRRAVRTRVFQKSSPSSSTTWTWLRATLTSQTRSLTRLHLVSALRHSKTYSGLWRSSSLSWSTWLPRSMMSMLCPCASLWMMICTRLSKGTGPLRKAEDLKDLCLVRTCKTLIWTQVMFTPARPQAMSMLKRHSR